MQIKATLGTAASSQQHYITGYKVTCKGDIEDRYIETYLGLGCFGFWKHGRMVMDMKKASPRPLGPMLPRSLVQGKSFRKVWIHLESLAWQSTSCPILIPENHRPCSPRMSSLRLSMKIRYPRYAPCPNLEHLNSKLPKC